MKEKIYNDGLTGSQRYKKKNVQFNVVVSPELADKIKENAYNERLSANKFIAKCIENYLNLKENKYS